MYCTLDNLKSALPERILLQLTDDANDGEFVIDPPNEAYTNVLNAIGNAETQINSYVSGRYDLPFAVVPDLIRNLAVSQAIVNLYERNHEAVMPDAMIARGKAVIKTLEGLQKGTITLPGIVKSVPVEEYLTNKTEDDLGFINDVRTLY